MHILPGKTFHALSDYELVHHAITESLKVIYSKVSFFLFLCFWSRRFFRVVFDSHFTHSQTTFLLFTSQYLLFTEAECNNLTNKVSFNIKRTNEIYVYKTFTETKYAMVGKVWLLRKTEKDLLLCFDVLIFKDKHSQIYYCLEGPDQLLFFCSQCL